MLTPEQKEQIKARMHGEVAIEEQSQVPVTDEDFGLAGMLNALIQDEWQAIDGYNSALATVMGDNSFEEDLKAKCKVVFEDILAEENLHIGQLQEFLKIVSPNAEVIADGEQEAKEDLAAIVESIQTQLDKVKTFLK